MLSRLIRDLSHEQRQKLAERGITRQHLHWWTHAKRLPTEVQVADLADITGCSWAELQREVTVARAPEELRSRVARAVGKSVVGAAVTWLTSAVAAVVLLAAPEPAHAGPAANRDNV